MRKLTAWTITWAAVASLSCQAPRVAFAQQPAMTIDECRNLGDADVRNRVHDLAATNFKTELTSIDYQALVDTYWAKFDVNTRIDHEVDEAIAAIRADSSWLDRAYSTVSKSSAARYATAIADKTYNSVGFKSALEDLATGVAKDAGAQIEKATSKIANPIVTCVQTALQSRYGGAIAQVFAQESQKNLEANAEQPPIKIQTSDLILNNAASISGIVLIVTRRVIGTVIEGVGRRIVGVVAGRIVSSVAGLVGLALIARDIYEAGEGVFPIVAERMKADDTKALIKTEVAKTIQSDINQQAETIAQETAERIYAVWLDFKQKYNRLLSLSEKSPAFAQFLKDRRLDQLNKLGQIVDILYGSEGEQRVLESVADGSLNKALTELNDAGLTIAEQQKSVGQALKWTEIAGNNLGRVVDLGIYRWLSPEGLTHATLDKVLTLNDKVALARIANLDPRFRDVILNLPGDQMRIFARRLSDRQLAALADYQERLEPAAAHMLLRSVSEDPGLMDSLSGDGLRRGIFNSRDQLAALNMILHDDASLLSYGRILKDAQQIGDGAVSYRVFWERYWLSITVAGLVLLLFLSWLRRLLFWRPQAPVKEQKKLTKG